MLSETDAYARRTRKSKDLYLRAKRVAPGGVMANVEFYSPYPFFAARGSGSRITDVDGNDYIDYCLCYGAMILGHANKEIVEAVTGYLQGDHSTAYGVPTELEVVLSEKIAELSPSAHMVRFTNSGTEATLLALRTARAYSGKNMVAKFEGHYHGWHDFAVISQSPASSKRGPRRRPRSVPDSIGIPREIARQTLVLPFNDLETTCALIKRYRRQIGAVILEPVPRGYILPDIDFLKGLRETTRASDIPLIFDEVMTGFRLALGGAQVLFGVETDLTTFGKILGGGYPMGACTGGEELMESISPLKEEKVFHSGTFNASPVALVAGLKCIDILRRDGTYDHLNALGEEMRRDLADVLEGTGGRVFGIGSIFHILFSSLPKVANYRDASTADRSKLLSLDLGLLNRVCIFPRVTHASSRLPILTVRSERR